MTARILLVDDFEPWRVRVRSILERNPCFRVVGEAGDGLEAVERASALLPDVVLLDVRMPRLNGLEAAQKIKESCSECKIIFLTQDHNSLIREAALDAGASAYLLKSQAKCELLATIEAAMLAATQDAHPKLPVSSSSR